MLSVKVYTGSFAIYFAVNCLPPSISLCNLKNVVYDYYCYLCGCSLSMLWTTRSLLAWTMNARSWFWGSLTSWGNTPGISIWKHGSRHREFSEVRRMLHQPLYLPSNTRRGSEKPWLRIFSLYRISGRLEQNVRILSSSFFSFSLKMYLFINKKMSRKPQPQCKCWEK